jgi:predicted HicB family RNase H-like nuclease
MISDKNTRTLITLPKELKEKLETIAKKENRSLNNLILTILLREVEKN